MRQSAMPSDSLGTMKHPRISTARLLKGILTGAALGVIVAAGVGRADNAALGPAWASPGAQAIKRIGSIDISRHEPAFLSNLDCDQTDYRRPGSSVMQTGCFTRTAFGLVDSDSETVIFNGTDEGLPLIPYSTHQVLAPWPQTLNILTLDNAPLGGTYMGFYKNPLSVMQDQRDALLRLISKRLTAPPEISLRDPDGRQLIINPQTLAFSPNGVWLAAETFSGAFMRINLATLDVQAFAPSYGMTGSPALLKSQVAVSDDGNYVAIGNNAASELKVYDLSSCANTGAGWQMRRCAAHDYWPFVRQQVSGLQSLRHIRFVNEELLSFEVRSSDAANNGVYVMSPKGSVRSLTDYLALGDSYTSGEGAFDYMNGTDSGENSCHLSVNSYPLLVTRALYSSSGGHSVACSGAVINDLGSTSPNYRGQVRGGFSFAQLQQDHAAFLSSIMASYAPGYVAQHRFAKQYQPATITVSIGGNDIGFGDILARCVMPRISLHHSDNDCYNTYEDRQELISLIDRTIPRWTALYRELLADAPGTRLYAVGYPQIVADTGNCALNVHLSQNEREFAEELTDYLNHAVQKAAGAAGATYVDIGDALKGHRLCEAASYDVAVNGLTAGKDAGILGIGLLDKESYHPNALGHALIEQAILKQTHNLTEFAGDAIDNVYPVITEAPKTGRKVNALIPAKLTAPMLYAGSHTDIHVDGPASGLKPHSAYDIRLGGSNGRIIGSATTNANGNVAADVTLPGDTPAGGQTLDITGENQAGDSVDISQPVYVPAGENDLDGDGIANKDDSCPGAANSGQDSDNDGIDDSCDGFISRPVALGSAGPGQGGSANSGTDIGAYLDQTAGIVTIFPAAGSGSGQGGGQNIANNPQNSALPPSSLRLATMPRLAVAKISGETSSALRAQSNVLSESSPVINLPPKNKSGLAWLLLLLILVIIRLAVVRKRFSGYIVPD